MKLNLNTILMWITLLTFVLVITIKAASAQNTLSEQPYYVVVGGFVSRDNAERFAAQLVAKNFPARYALNANHKLYYVYVELTTDSQYAKKLTHRLRVETEFKDAWIYNGVLDGNGLMVSVLAESSRVAEPDRVPAGKRFVFQVTNAVTNRPVDGVIQLLQSEPDAHYLTYNANEEITVPAPESGKLIVVCNLTGYKLAKRAFNYADPTLSIKGASIGSEEEVIIPIKLVPMTKGDYMELEHVKFVGNSAILKPTSEPELMALASLMSNPRCKIKLYGHTYNRADCDIVSLGNSTEFFALDPTNNNTRRGSAKELSYERAETVKAYLVSQGIAPGRIATKGYGAALAIYEHESANERIEVQITRN